AAIKSFYGRLETSSDDGTERPLLLVHLLAPWRTRRQPGGRAFRDDLGGFAIGVLMVVLLVVATATFLAM
ncbi:MAG TPA: hypothetical protein VFZ98_02680, partial [Vicinamibacterales bacterium]